MTQKAITFSRIAPCLFSIIVDYMGFGLVYPLVTAMFTPSARNGVSPHRIDLRSGFLFKFVLFALPLVHVFRCLIPWRYVRHLWPQKSASSFDGWYLAELLLMAYGIYVHSIGLFLVGRGASGLMAGSQPLCMAAIADLSTAENKARNMSLVTLTNCIGLVLGPFIGGVFTEAYFLQWAGFSFPFFLAAAFALVGLGLIYFLFQETFIPNREKTVKFTRPLTIFFDAFKHHHISLLVSVVFSQLLGLMIYYQIMGIYLRDLFHYSSAQLGYFYAFVGLFFALGILIVLPRALKRWQLEEIVGLWLSDHGHLRCGQCAVHE
jgi:DHA1 family tetracycline resistance protein-like MFS transporter